MGACGGGCVCLYVGWMCGRGRVGVWLCGCVSVCGCIWACGGECAGLNLGLWARMCDCLTGERKQAAASTKDVLAANSIHTHAHMYAQTHTHTNTHIHTRTPVISRFWSAWHFKSISLHMLREPKRHVALKRSQRIANFLICCTK